MKKLLLFGFAAMMLMACKKDWTCVCYGSGGQVTDASIIKNRTKSKAKKICRGDVNVGVIKVDGNSNCDVEEFKGVVVETGDVTVTGG